MKILVIGAGALGAYFGGRLHESGHEVSFLVRERRANQLKQNGIEIHSPHGNYKIEEPAIIRNANEAEDIDLVFLSVKGYHLPGTIDTLKTLVDKGAKVLPVLNGVEHISVLQKELGEESVIGGLSFIIATLDENGHVIHSSQIHDLIFGALHQSQQEVVDELGIACEQAKFDGKLSNSILKEVWKKYMFITAFSGITTAVNLPIGEIRKHPETFHIARKILEDMQQLANSHGLELTDAHVDKAFESMENLGEEATSSMHQDRRKGLTLEVEHLHGGALRLGDTVGLKLPYIEAIYGIIKPFENP
ncbi:2-dehydropantoate 2-reductase [Thalassobacillus devorans]|uniref:2-dehydropantoate 2-reductase n=1 Tax=Thalassobacillus devorans TaxID=279813 RepID=A0ABQ1PVJ7_9BACI|nr:ketopantoate reductase family protein [Thalassobacillus devorans]NIK30856.1 2-dehydropantoate 2-reductase [Thalassobacillus devorans]GGD04811.1 2-dehydropantoate 2-reductase [Thalassobacillus devorans]